ncbi:MAG: M23 family metallopeptidase [Leucobacter sp.]
MSAPALLGCAAAALCLGLPVIAASSQLEAQHRIDGAADAAALAAADALAGWVEGEPCVRAQEVVEAMHGRLRRCDLDEGGELTTASILASASTPLGGAEARARAGFETPAGSGGGVIGANGWAWPSDVVGVTQGFHDGLSIDLAVTAEGALYAPYDGVVVVAGPDGGGIPPLCRARPEWWHGANITVMIRHVYRGRVLYSSHNHVDPASLQRFGIEPGARVRSGQRVAMSGMTGCTSGPHSHFTLSTRPANAYPDVDPFAYIGSPSRPDPAP